MVAGQFPAAEFKRSFAANASAPVRGNQMESLA
jgi:hypothetical protein